jgi:ADP-heptose:LPS heptosyltransferase
MFWASSSGFEQNSFRSVELKDYMSVLGNKGYPLYSLQIHTDNKDADEYPEIKQSLLVPNREYADTFSIIQNLDMVVTSCTFVAHVAASLGKEVCVFVPIMEYYVWTSSTGKCMWYGDNVHLFRQKKPRNWDEPLKQLKEFLNDRGI